MSLGDLAQSEHGEPATPYLLDGGDLACGELLLRVVALLPSSPPGTVVRLVATDPAAPLDVPAWCHLTGHAYEGAGRQPDGRPHYDIRLARAGRPTVPGRPWHLLSPR